MSSSESNSRNRKPTRTASAISTNCSSSACPLQEEIRRGIEFVAAHNAPDKTVSDAPVIRPAADAIGQVNRRQRQSGQPASSPSPRKALSGWQEYAHALLLTN